MALNSTCYIVIVAYSNATGTIIPAPTPFTGCMLLSGYEKSFIMFVTSIVFETMMITLTVIKAYPLAQQREMRTPLFTMIFKDGLVYYFSLLALHILSLILIFTPSLAASSTLASYPLLVVMTITCNRLLIRQQRMLLGPGQDMDTDFFSTDLRTMSITFRTIHRHGNVPSFLLES
jgi:hypothetical protein